MVKKQSASSANLAKARAKKLELLQQKREMKEHIAKEKDELYEKYKQGNASDDEYTYDYEDYSEDIPDPPQPEPKPKKKANTKKLKEEIELLKQQINKKPAKKRKEPKTVVNIINKKEEEVVAKEPKQEEPQLTDKERLLKAYSFLKF